MLRRFRGDDLLEALDNFAIAEALVQKVSAVALDNLSSPRRPRDQRAVRTTPSLSGTVRRVHLLSTSRRRSSESAGRKTASSSDDFKRISAVSESPRASRRIPPREKLLENAPCGQRVLDHKDCAPRACLEDPCHGPEGGNIDTRKHYPLSPLFEALSTLRTPARYPACAVLEQEVAPL